MRDCNVDGQAIGRGRRNVVVALYDSEGLLVLGSDGLIGGVQSVAANSLDDHTSGKHEDAKSQPSLRRLTPPVDPAFTSPKPSQHVCGHCS